MGATCLSLMLMVVACTNTTPPPTTTAGDSLYGDAFLQDTAGFPAPSNAGITVTADGTTLSTQTNSVGHWVIHNVPAATYNLTLSSPGYVSSRLVGYAVPIVSLYDQLLNHRQSYLTTPLSVSAYAKSVVYHDSAFWVSYDFGGKNWADFELLAGGDPDFVDTSSGIRDQEYNGGKVSGPQPISLHDLGDIGLKSGMTVYFKICALPKNSLLTNMPPNVYWNPSFKRFIYVVHGPLSNVLSAKIP
jgi:hypothetical protein